MTTYTEIPPSLASFLKKCRNSAMTFTQSNDLSSTFNLGKILEILHHKRLSVPNDLKKFVINTIFQIHDQALHSPNPLIKQQAHVSAISGFLRGDSVKDLKVMNQILNRIALTDFTRDTLPTTKKLVQKTLDLYLEQNYQSQDTNLSLAHKLKFLIQSIGEKRRHGNSSDKPWLSENAQKLAQIDPIFQPVADQFHWTPKNKRGNYFSNRPHCLGEAVEIYAKPSFKQTDFLRE